MRLSRLGINLDPRNPGGRPDPAQVGLFGWARVVLRPQPACAQYVAALHAAGINTLAVIASESLSRHRAPYPEVRAYADHYAGIIGAWQFGNEMDIESPASWTLPPADYARFHRECERAIREVNPHAVIITGGSASGLTHYLEASGVQADGVAAHPYGQRVGGYPHAAWGFGEVPDLLDRYATLGKPLWITEYGVDEQDVHGADKRAGQAEYLVRMTDALLTDPRVAVAFIFCHSDAMVRGYGLVDSLGVPKPALTRIQEYASQRQEEPVMPTSPHHGGRRARTDGVVIHSTRGGAPYGREFQAAINWFANPKSQVSAHAVVSRQGEVAYPVADELIAWHARDFNATWLGIEFEQPTIADGYTEAQLQAGAAVVRAWCEKYGIPIDREHIRGHSEIPPGIKDGKSDPGPTWPWERFMMLLGAAIERPKSEQPASLLSHLDAAWGALDRLQQLAARLEAEAAQLREEAAYGKGELENLKAVAKLG